VCDRDNCLELELLVTRISLVFAALCAELGLQLVPHGVRTTPGLGELAVCSTQRRSSLVYLSLQVKQVYLQQNKKKAKAEGAN
jgi:hypothetical protein